MVVVKAEQQEQEKEQELEAQKKAEGAAEGAAESKSKKDEKDSEYWRQQAQQNDANARRERLAREESEKAVTETKTQLTQLNQKLQELEKKSEQQSQYQEMDTDLVDPAVAKNIESLQKQIQALSGEVSNQQAKIVQYEQNEARREQDRQYNEAVEQICKPLDDRYGQKYRSEARTLADKAVEDGTEKKPQTTLEAYLLHEKFYKTLSEKKDKTKTTSTDTGKSTVPVKVQHKPGKLMDVLNEMKSRAKS